LHYAPGAETLEYRYGERMKDEPAGRGSVVAAHQRLAADAPMSNTGQEGFFEAFMPGKV